jgi:hypothetical protein
MAIRGTAQHPLLAQSRKSLHIVAPAFGETHRLAAILTADGYS